MNRRLQLTLLAVATLILAIAATAWWLSSPLGVRRMSEAIVLLVGAICGLGHCRRLPSRSPLVLCAALVGLVIALFARPTGPLFPSALALWVGGAWTGVAIARMSALRNRMSGAKP